MTQGVTERRAKLRVYRRFLGQCEARARVPAAGPVMRRNARLPGTSVRLDTYLTDFFNLHTTYKSNPISAVIGKKCPPLTVAAFVSAFETHYPYALATGQLLAVLYYLSSSYWIVRLSLSLRVCQNVPPGGRGVAPGGARKIRIGPLHL